VTGLTGLSSVEVSYGLSSTTGSFVPKVTATRPLGGKITARLKSELAKEQTSSASIEYPLNSEFDLITSWKNAPTVANPQSSTGSFDIGVRYQNTYPGLRILPPNLLKQREEGR
jgi:hypothetical protein